MECVFTTVACSTKQDSYAPGLNRMIGLSDIFGMVPDIGHLWSVVVICGHHRLVCYNGQP